MAKKNTQKSFEKLRQAAQTFTVSSAILLGVTWVITSALGHEGGLLGSLSAVLFTATAVGGVVMGLLYLVHLFKKQ
jgi:hypothetical protein